MALIFMEGFDDGLMQQKGWVGTWQPNNYPSTVTGRFGGKAMQEAYLGGVQRNYATPLTGTVIVGCGVMPWGTTSTMTILTHGMARLKVATGGNLALYRSDTDAQVAITPGAVWTTGNVWRFVELKYVVSTGVCEVRIDGVVVLSGTVPTATSIASIIFPNQANGTYINIDDIYVLDATGTANNTYLGDVRVQTLLPSAEGTNLGMTPDTGTVHYSRVNEAAPDTTSYVSTASAGVKDSYRYQQLAANTSSVYGVAVTSYASKDAPVAAGIATLVRLGSTDYVNAQTQSLSASWVAGTDLYQVRPNDSAPWTPTDINGAEFGVQTS